MAPHARFSADSITKKAQKDLLNLLEGVRGKKNLVLEKDLAGPVGQFVKFSTLQDYGVDKVFFLENGNADTTQQNVVFIARGECAKTTQMIADQIKLIQRESQISHEFTILWVPRRTLVADRILEEAGVLGDTSTFELPLFFIPLEKDLLSLELYDSFSGLYLRQDPTPTFLMGKALMELQRTYGLFPRITGKGDNAKKLADLMSRMRSEANAGEEAPHSRTPLNPSTVNESLIIIDREVDFATPLLTQLTYEGLLDETLGIQNNQAEVDSSLVGSLPPTNSQASTAPQSRTKKVQLDSLDKLYDQLRDENFAVVGSLLHKVARRLQTDYDSRHGKQTTAELREFVNNLKGYQAEQQSLKIHTGLAEEVMKYTRTSQFGQLLEVQQNLAAGADPASQHDTIEELIAKDAPLSEVLRVLCLESCIAGGLRLKDLEHFKRLILQAYGYQHILTLDALEKLQLLYSKSASSGLMIPVSGAGNTPSMRTDYAYLRRQLRLIVDEVNEQEPSDIAYVYSGYAPLSVRLVQCVLQKQYVMSLSRASGVIGNATASSISSRGAHGWKGFDDVLKHTRGAAVDEVQKGEDLVVKARSIVANAGDKKTVFVVFLGGITYTEIAALRFIAKKEQDQFELIICTTSVINGRKMMDAATETASFLENEPLQASRGLT